MARGSAPRREISGLTHLRYALPWHKIESRRGNFDWGMADERIGFCRDLGLELYLDVMHFGVPQWLAQAAGDPEFPESLEAFSEAIVTRYRDSIHTWCPCNEPLVLALFSGDLGFWPPHARHWRGYMPVLSRIVQAVSRSIRAIRRVQHEATIMHCDNVEHYQTREPELCEEVSRRNLRRFLVLDLLTGAVDRQHPLYEWMVMHGFSELDLDWFRSNPQTPDIIGMDYYPNSEWRLEKSGSVIRQRRSERAAGVYGIGSAYYNRYGLPLMLTETSTDGKPINREIWLDKTIEDCRRLRAEGVPMLGYFWWPLFDQIDWDGALTHRVGKIHQVGLYSLRREHDGTLAREVTPLVEQFSRAASAGNARVGELDSIALPTISQEQSAAIARDASRQGNGNGNGNGNGHVPPLAAVSVATGSHPGEQKPGVARIDNSVQTRATGPYGIVVFSHLRWGFVWQRPQQFLSRLARRHRILFVEEPLFDLPEGQQPRHDLHQVMPNVTVVAPHFSPSGRKDRTLTSRLREMTRQAIEAINEDGEFDQPLLWYYSPMDSAWSLGHFASRGIVYDCMDELSQFTVRTPALIQQEARLIRHADVIFAGGHELGEKKRAQHHSVHTFGCGVEYQHFSRASDPRTIAPPDIDFMDHPIIGWFGVVDERVDYGLVGEMARQRPDWSFAMIGPVVKIDPNLLPHSPNLFWLGSRDYQALPSYCRAFDVCMMPFALNKATQFINPTKALEYMACGKPIVSTPVRDVVRQWTDIIRIAATPLEFVECIEAALQAGPDDQRVTRGKELAQSCSWDSTVSQLQSLIDQALSRKDRAAATRIAPLTDIEIESVYTSTQGS